MSQEQKKMKITPPIFFLGLASFFTDVSSEAIYPLLPVYLSLLGASSAFIGLVEGVAESTASITKFIFGWLSDKYKKRESLVIGGYSIANGIRPLIGLVTSPGQVLGLRFIDRIGKGMRTAPRDAWLASLAPAEGRATVFGFHRAMDHAGAMIGPLLATAFLWIYPGRYRSLFLWTLVPGFLGVMSLLLARRAAPSMEGGVPASLSFKSAALPRHFKYYLGILFLFTLGNSSDAFLLLKLRNAGVEEKFLPLLWACLHFVKSSSSIWGGRFADRAGKKLSILLGWFLYAIVYVAFGWFVHWTHVVPIFLIYGLFYGLTEGAEKALAANFVPPDVRGTAFGLYNLTIGIGALPASLMFGWLWMKISLAAAFYTGASMALMASVLLFLLPLDEKSFQ